MEQEEYGYIEEMKEYHKEIIRPKNGTELIATTAEINKRIEKYSPLQKFFMQDHIQDGKAAKYPLPSLYDYEDPLWILPGMGYVAQDYMELLGTDIYIPLFSVQASKNWKIKYMREARYDVIEKAIERVAEALGMYQTEAAWRLLWPAVTADFDGAGILPPRKAPIVRMPPEDKASTYLSKELINRMYVTAKRRGRKLTELIISPEDHADLREWTAVDGDQIEIYSKVSATVDGINITVTDVLGAGGRYNINSYNSGYSCFKVNSKNKFNDYELFANNKVDGNSDLVQYGDTQIIGLCGTPSDYLKMPFKPFKAYSDMTLLRKQQMGFYGWMEFGMACLDPGNLVMGVINRSYLNSTLPKRQITRDEWFEIMTNLLRK